MLATAAAIRCTVTAWQAARMSSAERAESAAEEHETNEAGLASIAAMLVADEDREEP